MNWNVLTVIWGEPNPLGRRKLNQLQLSGLSSQISGLVDLGWGTGKCILKIAYSDSDGGNALKWDVRKAVGSLFLKWMDDTDRTPSSQAASFATATAASCGQCSCNICRKPSWHLTLNSGLFCHTAPRCHKENTLANCYVIVGKHQNLLKTFTNESQLLKLNTRCLLQCVALRD